MYLNKYMFAVLTVGLLFLFSGCIESPKSDMLVEEKIVPTNTVPPIQSKYYEAEIIELENKVNVMQDQINELQKRLDGIGVPIQNNKTLIPKVPFRIEVRMGEWQSPTSWIFLENGQIEIKNPYGVEYGKYKLYSNNNTIKISSPKYEFYGIVLYDDYLTAIYRNGWVAWVKDYNLVPPTYNSITQKYELN